MLRPSQSLETASLLSSQMSGKYILEISPSLALVSLEAGQL